MSDGKPRKLSEKRAAREARDRERLALENRLELMEERDPSATRSSLQAMLLRSTLEVAVPLHILEMRKLSWAQIEAIAKESADVIAAKGDVLQFGGGKKGETAAAFNSLARGLAAAAHCPGGVKFLGCHWEAKRP